jgi:hypothetical protein
MTDAGRILVRRLGSSWVTPETGAYDDEGHLQSLLAHDPARIPGVADEAFAVRELATSGGPIDVCIVDPDGTLTVVECKLASSSERRRMVIGQVIDYASAIWHDGERSFFASWRRHGGDELGEVLTPVAIEQLRSNIADARINLCLAVDLIDADLRRLVEYLNLVTPDQISVTALQLAYARHGDLEILIPSSFGGEIAAAKVRSSKRSSVPWTRESFLGALAGESDRQLANRLFDLLDGLGNHRGTHGTLWFGASPSGGVFFHPYGLRFAPFQLWINKAEKLMAFGNWKNYNSLAGHPGFAELAELLNQDYHQSARGVPVESLQVDEFWSAALRCADAINPRS